MCGCVKAPERFLAGGQAGVGPRVRAQVSPAPLRSCAHRDQRLPDDLLLASGHACAFFPFCNSFWFPLLGAGGGAEGVPVRGAGRPARPSRVLSVSLPPAGPSLAGLCSARAVGDTGFGPNTVVGLGQGPCEPPASLGRRTWETKARIPHLQGQRGLRQRTPETSRGLPSISRDVRNHGHMLTAAGV